MRFESYLNVATASKGVTWLYRPHRGQKWEGQWGCQSSNGVSIHPAPVTSYTLFLIVQVDHYHSSPYLWKWTFSFISSASSRLFSSNFIPFQTRQFIIFIITTFTTRQIFTLPFHDKNASVTQILPNTNCSLTIDFTNLLLHGGPKNGLFLEVCNSRMCWHRISNYSAFYPE